MPELKFKILFDLGSIVYLKTDTIQFKGIVLEASKAWNGGVMYKVKFVDDYEWYQAIELTTEKEEEPKPQPESDSEDDDDE